MEPIAAARALVLGAREVLQTQEAHAAAEAAELAHLAAWQGSPSGRSVRGGDRAWCPARGMSLPEGHPLCPCGIPCGAECLEVGRTGAGAKGANAGAKRLTRAQQAEAQALAAATAEAEAVLQAARAALEAVAGPAAAVAALLAVPQGDGPATAILAVLLGLPLMPADEEARPEVAAVRTWRPRRARKLGAPAPALADLAAAQACHWARTDGVAALAAAGRDTADGVLSLGLLWLGFVVAGIDGERRRLAEALAARESGAAA